MIKKLFKSKQTLKEEENIKILEEEIKKVSSQIMKKDGFLKCKTDFIIIRDEDMKNNFDWEKMGNDLKKCHEENKFLKNELKEIYSMLGIESVDASYLVKIDKFLHELRYVDVVKKLQENGVFYLQFLNEHMIEKSIESEKLKEEVLKRYRRYLDGNMSWDLKTNLLKGDKISKIYLKYRKFINILGRMNISFMSELNYRVLNQLEINEYTPEEIEDIKRIYNEYNEKYLIKNSI